MEDKQGRATSRLLVTDQADKEVADDDSLFVVEDELTQVSSEQADRVYAELMNADVDTRLSLPIYEIGRAHILKNQRGSLYYSVLIYLRLEEVYEQKAPDAIVCDDGVDRNIKAVVRDFCDSYDVPLESTGGKVSKRGAIRRVLISAVLIVPFFADQLASLLLKRLTTSRDTTDVVFIPALGRAQSTLPVLREARGEFEFETIITSMASSWIWKYRNDDFDEFDPRPISEFTSVRLIGRQLSLFVSLAIYVVYGDDLTDELEGQLDKELGVELNNTLRYAVQNGFRTRLFLSIVMYHLFDELIETLGPESVVTGKLSPDGRALVNSSIANEVDAYHIPHGTGSADCPNPPKELTQFTSGEFDVRYYSESPQVKTPWNWVVTGRPYLTELHQEYGGSADLSSSEPYRLLLATQPFRYREAFVRDVLRATEDTTREFEIVIKIHPSEDPKFYSTFERQYPNVTVAEADLFEHLDDADLTLTVYSNVGLESIVVGTPCVLVNRWHPISPLPIYARYGPIENLHTSEQIASFLQEVTPTVLSELLETQQTAMYDGYEFEPNAPQRMVSEIRPGSTQHIEMSEFK